MPLDELAAQHDELNEEFYDMLAASNFVPHLPELAPLIAEAERRCDGTVAGFAYSASDLIHERFQYVKGATHVNSSIADSLQLGAGVCQDFAHLLLGVLRKRGIPARYVSGYLVPHERGKSRGQAGRSHWWPGFPRLGRSVYSGYRMDTTRSHAGQAGRHAPRAHRLRTRLR